MWKLGIFKVYFVGLKYICNTKTFHIVELLKKKMVLYEKSQTDEQLISVVDCT